MLYPNLRPPPHLFFFFSFPFLFPPSGHLGVPLRYPQGMSKATPGTRPHGEVVQNPLFRSARHVANDADPLAEVADLAAGYNDFDIDCPSFFARLHQRRVYNHRVAWSVPRCSILRHRADRRTFGALCCPNWGF